MATKDSGSERTGSGPSTSAAGATARGTPSGAPSSDASGSANGGVVKPLRDESRRLTEQAKERARSYANERKQMTADQVGGIAQALRSAADSLQSQDQATVAQYVSRAADNLDRVSNALRDRDVDALARQAQDLARQQPALLIGGAMVAGFLVARFAKASGGRQSGGDMSGSASAGRGGTSRMATSSEGGVP